MRVEVIQARHPMGRKRIGDVIPDMPGGQARDLIRRGIVREVGEKAIASPVNRMMGRLQVKKR